MMLITVVTTFVLIFSVTSGRVLLYNTENKEAIYKFDCVYYVYDDGEEIPYCQRLNQSEQLHRQNKECENQGERKMFHDLLDQNVRPSDVLDWSSSVEMADLYASVFYNRSLIEDDDARFLCNCTQSGTFGKYCEYELTHYAKSFSESINDQFEQKRNGDSWDTQRHGKILCYETLPCPSSPLCLDWREICDGVQRCSSGIDEENWDKLEFNECEDDEFRCTNGMCIPEEFWLDGDYDCMDWTDEVLFEDGETCPFKPNAMECDEHLCRWNMYSCGDGQCVSWVTRIAFQRFYLPANDCFNKRNLNYMCEASLHEHAWTLESGLCLPDQNYNDLRYPPWNITNLSQLIDNEKCQYLFRCALSDGLEFDCPCNQHNCTNIMINVCPDPKGNRRILYPPQGLINANIFFYYNYSQFVKTPTVDGVSLTGNLKCRGYHVNFTVGLTPPSSNMIIIIPRSHHILCILSHHGNLDSSSPLQYDKFCWNESRTFNGRPYAVNPGTCSFAKECISQYRIHDGIQDCVYGADENTAFAQDYCTGNVGRHRFQCFDEQHKCLPLNMLGTGRIDCSNNYDEMWFGVGLPVGRNIRCQKMDTADCDRWKYYIGESSTRNSNLTSSLVHIQEQTSISQISFQSYCDSFWDLKDHIDELTSSCQHWICENYQYQCRTGHCIDVKWVCDGEWDCPDASDEEALVLIQIWSNHNANVSGLGNRLYQCEGRYSESPFSTICNNSFEFGCYRPQVLNPLDITANRPCINLTQIGDGVEDCYNSYDEKNTFEADWKIRGMWGFHFRCESAIEQYSDVCLAGAINNCSAVLCSNHRDTSGSCSGYKDVICLEDNQCKSNARCDGKSDCFHGEDEYWCASNSRHNQMYYRKEKQISKRSAQFNYILRFPLASILKPEHQEVRQLIIAPKKHPFPTLYSYQCNRGVAILEMNETTCLCPPAYYGRWCEFFSDRISIIAHVDKQTVPKTMPKSTFKIRTNFLFNNSIVDHHEFNVFLTFEKVKNIKHRFYLLYSRTAEMLEHKRRRYFNQTDVNNNHPYSVHFDLFLLEKNSSVREVGSWHYPIYFDYLPAFRLAVVLRFSSWFGNVTLDPCSPNSCNENSTCIPILNQNNSYYCSCKSGYYGEDCNMYERQCETHCSANALCRPDDYELETKKNNPYCICPLGHFGSRCNLKSDDCDSNPCLNDATCFLTYDRSGETSYMCDCSKRFYGDRCEKEKASVRVYLNMTSGSSVRATVVQLYDIKISFLTLLIQHQKAYRGVPSTISYDHAGVYAPYLGVLKIYKDLSHPQYFIMYALRQSVINISSSPQECPHASSLLSQDLDQSVAAVFKYHEICRNDSERFCFHDEHYLCICDVKNYRAECFGHDPQLDHCDNCLSGGKCLRSDRKDPNDFTCICSPCHQGHRCEFNLEAFGFTLDSLLTDYSKQVKIAYVFIVCILFFIGLFNNFCSFTTFKRPSPRKFGVGNYLLIISCLNQTVLFCLLFKFIQITFGIVDVGSCKTMSYSLSVMTRSTYWLTSWITVDRLLMILFPTSSSLKNPRLAIGISVFTLIILLSMHVHEIIYYTIIQTFSTDLYICVTNFDTNLISTYDRISTLIHYLCPFFIQVICITLLIVLVARSRAKTVGHNMTFGEMLKKQFETQKELYVTPTILILSTLPQAILTFSFACTELNDWQRHTLLGSYLLSYAPQVLGFILYVLPSTSYKKEFFETWIGKNSSKWISLNKKSETTILKTRTKLTK